MAKARKQTAKRKANPRRTKSSRKAIDPAKVRQILAQKAQENVDRLLSDYAAGDRDFRSWDLRGGQFHNKNLKYASFDQADLIAANLFDADLANSSFFETLANDAIFDQAAIGNATFLNARLNSATFKAATGDRPLFEAIEGHKVRFNKAKLPGAKFTGAKVDEANFSGGTFTGADFARVNAIGSEFKSADLTLANFSYGNLEGCNFNECRADQAKFEHANLTAVSMVQAEARAADFSDAQMAMFKGASSQFSGSHFSGAGMNRWEAPGAIFVGCTFRYCSPKDADFTASDFNGAEMEFFKPEDTLFGACTFRNAKIRSSAFNDCQIHNADFTGADLLGTTFPGTDLSEVDLSVAKNVSRSVALRWKKEFKGKPAGQIDVFGPVDVTPEMRDAAIEDVLTRGIPEPAEKFLPAELRGPAPESKEAMETFFAPKTRWKLGVVNPKKRKKTPEWKRLINRCHKLWETYDDHPIKANLVAFGAHIEKMKASSSVRVKTEAARALRAYNKEFKERGWKKPAKKKASKKSTKKAAKKAPKRKAKKARRRASKNPLVSSVKELKDEIARGETTFISAQLGFAQLKGFKAKGLEFPASQFSHAQLQDSSLVDCNFTQAIFEEADFTGAILNKSSFSGVKLGRAVLDSVVAREAYFDDADLEAASMKGANFSKAFFGKAKMDGIDADGTVWFEADLRQASLWNAEVVRCTLDKANMAHAHLDDIISVKNSFERAILARSRMRGSNFAQCVFKFTDMSEVEAGHARFEGCNFIISNMQDSDFKNASFLNCTFSAVNLAHVDLKGADFDGSQFDLGGGMDWTNVDLTGAKNVDPAALNEWANATAQARQQVGAIMGKLGMGVPAGGSPSRPWHVIFDVSDGKWYIAKAGSTLQQGPFQSKSAAQLRARVLNSQWAADADVEELRSDLSEIALESDEGEELTEEERIQLRQDKNLRWAMEHEFGRTLDKEGAARWADEEAEEEEDSPPWEKQGKSFAEWFESNPKSRKKKPNFTKAQEKKLRKDIWKWAQANFDSIPTSDKMTPRKASALLNKLAKSVPLVKGAPYGMGWIIAGEYFWDENLRGLVMPALKRAKKHRRADVKKYGDAPLKKMASKRRLPNPRRKPKKKAAKVSKTVWHKRDHEEFPQHDWHPKAGVTYTVKRMYGSMFAAPDDMEYVYSVTRKGPRSTSRVSAPGVGDKLIPTLKEAKAFAKRDFEKRERQAKRKKKS